MQAEAVQSVIAPSPAQNARRRRRPWHLSPDGFRELRLGCLLSRKTCAGLLGCSESAVRAWDEGRNRVPWSAVKLLRLFRLGDLGALRPEWHGWTINHNGLVSPEGIAYSRGDLGWWSLTCRQAECWRQDRQRQRQRATGRSVSEPHLEPLQGVVPLGELPLSSSFQLEAAPLTASLPGSGRSSLNAGEALFRQGARAARDPAGTGLVYYSTSSTQNDRK